MYKKSRPRAEGLLGSVLLLGMLFLLVSSTSPAYGASGCPADIAGTQSYVECVERSGDGNVTRDLRQGTAEPGSAGASIGTAGAWQLTVAGLAGVLLGVGATFGARLAVEHRHLHAAP